MMEAETQPKITSEVKVKNPKRVEAGKKLAALSKAARDRKKECVETTVVKYTALGVVGLLASCCWVTVLYM